MARISMECKCGWKFFLAGTAQGWEAACPNCGLGVPIPGRKPGQKVFATAGHLAAEKEKGWKMARLAIGLGAVMVVAIIVLLVVMSGGGPPPRTEDPSPTSPAPRDRACGAASTLPRRRLPLPPTLRTRSSLPRRPASIRAPSGRKCGRPPG